MLTWNAAETLSLGFLSTAVWHNGARAVLLLENAIAIFAFAPRLALGRTARTPATTGTFGEYAALAFLFGLYTKTVTCVLPFLATFVAAHAAVPFAGAFQLSLLETTFRFAFPLHVIALPLWCAPWKI